MTVAQLLRQWLDEGAPAPKGRERGRKYLLALRRAVEHHIVVIAPPGRAPQGTRPGGLGPVPLRLLDPERVDRWLHALRRAGHSPLVIREARETLGRALWWATRRGLVRENVAAVEHLTHLPAAPEPERRSLRDAEVEALVAAAWAESPTMGTLVVLGLETGLRISELLGLVWGDLDGDVLHVERQARHEPGDEGERGTFVIDAPLKTKAAVREIALTPPALAALELLRAEGPAPLPTAPLFRSVRGGYLRIGNLYRREWARTLEAAGIGVGFHALRRTFATRAHRAGVPYLVLKDLLGHRRPSGDVTGAAYVALTEIAERRAAMVRFHAGRPAPWVPGPGAARAAAAEG